MLDRPRGKGHRPPYQSPMVSAHAIHANMAFSETGKPHTTNCWFCGPHRIECDRQSAPSDLHSSNIATLDSGPLGTACGDEMEDCDREMPALVAPNWNGSSGVGPYLGVDVWCCGTTALHLANTTLTPSHRRQKSNDELWDVAHV
jgi:hypothetical protein